MKTEIKILLGDITTLAVDVIVNAANKTLLGGRGVDGAIHIAAGPELLAECIKLHGCPTGEAKITKGYNLKASYIIHTVGPIFGQENGKEADLLSSCYINSLVLADKYYLNSIAFPAISTGAYGYPKEEAAKVVYQTIKNYLQKKHYVKTIIFVLYSEDNYSLYLKLFNKIRSV